MSDAVHLPFPSPSAADADRVASSHVALDVAHRTFAVTGAHAPADFVVMHQHSDGSLTAVVADVCGHGDAAADVAAAVRPAVQEHVRQAASPNVLLERINAALAAHTSDGGFLATAVAALIEPDRRLISWASAGHAPPHLLSTGAPINGAVPGPPIGVRSFVGCTTGSCRLREKGDGVLLYTDGLADVRAADGSRFGAARIAATLQELDTTRAGDVTAELERRVLEFGGGTLADDMCMVVVRLP